MNNLLNYLEHLRLMINLSINQHINLLTLSPDTLAELQKLLYSLFNEKELLPFNELYLIEILDLCELNCIITQKELVFILEIPIIYPTNHKFFNLYSVVINNTLMMPEKTTIVESYKFVYVKECLLLSNNKSYCTQVTENWCDLYSLKNCSFIAVDNYTKVQQFRNQFVYKHKYVSTKVKTETELFTVHRPSLIALVKYAYVNDQYFENNDNKIGTKLQVPHDKSINFTVPTVREKQLMYLGKIDISNSLSTLENLQVKHNVLHAGNYVISFIIIVIMLYLLYVKFFKCKRAKITRTKKELEGLEGQEKSIFQLKPLMDPEAQS